MLLQGFDGVLAHQGTRRSVNPTPVEWRTGEPRRPAACQPCAHERAVHPQHRSAIAFASVLFGRKQINATLYQCTMLPIRNERLQKLILAYGRIARIILIAHRHVNGWLGASMPPLPTSGVSSLDLGPFSLGRPLFFEMHAPRPPQNRPRLSICAPCAPGRDRRTPLPKLPFAGSGALSARNRQIGRAGRFSRPGSEFLAVRNKKLFPELTNHKPAVRPPGGSIAFFAIVIGAAQFTLCIATSTNLFVCRCPPWAFPP